MRSALALIAAVTLIGCVRPLPSDLSDIDRRASLPREADRPISAYARYYLSAGKVTIDSLPFTTVMDPLPRQFDPDRSVIAALYLLPEAPIADQGTWERQPGIHEVDRLPTVIHGGCLAINLLFDPMTGDQIAAWCNADG